MKKLLLTSNGLTSKKINKEFLKLIDRPLGLNRILIIHTANKRKHFRRINRLKKEFSLFGILKGNIFEANINQKIKASKFGNFEIVYVCGGNTFYILDRIRKTGFDKWLEKFVRMNGVYVGVSAGSIIVHNTIEIAGYGSVGDINEIGLKNLKGLGLTKIAILPHFKKRIKKEFDVFKRKVNYPVVYLKDKQALLILSNKTKKIN